MQGIENESSFLEGRLEFTVLSCFALFAAKPALLQHALVWRPGQFNSLPSFGMCLHTTVKTTDLIVVYRSSRLAFAGNYPVGTSTKI